MLIGIALAVTAGFIWSLSGVANSCCAKFKLDIITYLFANVLFSALITLVIFVDLNLLLTHNTLKLAAVMIPSGMLNTGGALMLQKALQKGHHGIVFLIGQSALILPFIFGVVILGEPTTVLRCSGAALIFLGMASCAVPKIKGTTPARPTGKAWLLYALASFFLAGSSQALMSLPSYWKDFTDQAQARTTLLYTGSTILMIGMVIPPSIRRRMDVNKKLVLCGLAVAILNSISMRLIFTSLDHLSKVNLTSIGFSLAIASSLVAFTCYSIFVLKEKCYVWTMAGLCLIVIGGFCLA